MFAMTGNLRPAYCALLRNKLDQKESRYVDSRLWFPAPFCRRSLQVIRTSILTCLRTWKLLGQNTSCQSIEGRCHTGQLVRRSFKKSQKAYESACRVAPARSGEKENESAAAHAGGTPGRNQAAHTRCGHTDFVYQGVCGFSHQRGGESCSSIPRSSNTSFSDQGQPSSGGIGGNLHSNTGAESGQDSLSGTGRRHHLCHDGRRHALFYGAALFHGVELDQRGRGQCRIESRVAQTISGESASPRSGLDQYSGQARHYSGDGRSHSLQHFLFVPRLGGAAVNTLRLGTHSKSVRFLVPGAEGSAAAHATQQRLIAKGAVWVDRYLYRTSFHTYISTAPLQPGAVGSFAYYLGEKHESLA